jgi:WD40 repeat protein
MFACNDGVVGVVDFFTNMEQVAGELWRESPSSEGTTQEPINFKVTCMSMSPSTSYLAVGGADGKVAVYDSTCNWAEIQLLDIGSHNDVADDDAPDQVKVTALCWSPESTYLIIGDNRGNIFLVTTVGRVSMAHSMASSGRSSAMVEMLLPSDEPPAKPAWRIVKAIFNRTYTYDERYKQYRQESKTCRKKKEKVKVKGGNASLPVPAESSTDGGIGRSGAAQPGSGTSDDSDYEDGYSDFRLDPLEAVTCLDWSADAEYIVAGRRNCTLTLYMNDEKHFG